MTQKKLAEFIFLCAHNGNIKICVPVAPCLVNVFGFVWRVMQVFEGASGWKGETRILIAFFNSSWSVVVFIEIYFLEPLKADKYIL